VSITNTGDRAGDEVVQLYVSDDVSSLTRPDRELRGFQRITLQPGETHKVTFSIGPEQLAFWKDGEWIAEPGTFGVLVGASSTSVQRTALRECECYLGWPNLWYNRVYGSHRQCPGRRGRTRL